MDKAVEERVFAEVIALRIMVQRTIGNLALAVGDVPGVAQREHVAALKDLGNFEINDPDPARAARIRMNAEAVLDQVYSVVGQGKPS